MALNVVAAAIGMVLQWVEVVSGEVGSGNSGFLSLTYIVRDFGCDSQVGLSRICWHNFEHNCRF